ncbi:VOC family protein [Saccharopolyspora indica]|uniref:VOC family protein n=1 Tax=Saccharopolyspora indica TaxID=1229659 RepID=UPI0022EB6595|nr:VOC family protein [Saccharopolyspora indica]MDA3644151.1 VOC family protein [Saccharopolyspora indica]
MSIPRLLDHVVIAGPDLADLVNWFAERTGVTAAPGGVHPRGTANALIALTIGGLRGPQYIELIGPDPGSELIPDVFGIADLDRPRIVTYAIRPDDIDATVARARNNGYDPGDVTDLSRRTPDGDLLEWRLARGDGSRPDVPFLIDWGHTPHPGLADVPALELLSLQRIEPDPEPTHRAVAAHGLEASAVADTITGSPAGFRLELQHPDGTHITL